MRLKQHFNFHRFAFAIISIWGILLFLTGCAWSAASTSSPEVLPSENSEEPESSLTPSPTSNTESETIEFLSSLDEFQEIALQKKDELELFPTEYVCFLYNGQYVTVGGGIKQDNLSSLRGMYPELMISDTFLDYEFQYATLDFKSAPSFQVSNAKPDGITLDNVYSPSATDDLGKCTYLRFVYGDDNIQITMMPSDSKTQLDGLEWDIQSEGNGYAIVSSSNAGRTAMQLNMNNWTYYIESPSESINFYDELAATDYANDLPTIKNSQ